MNNGNNHISPERLDLFLLIPDQIEEEERLAIQYHLEQCAFCREEADDLKALYADLSKRLATPPTDLERQLAHRFQTAGRLVPSRYPGKGLDRVLDGYVEVMIEKPKSLTRRIRRFVVEHPVKTAGRLGLAAGLIGGLFLLRNISRDDNPVSVKVRNYVLTTYNKAGDELWTRHVPGIPDDSGGVHLKLAGDRHRLLTVEDVDGDERNEVLFTGWVRGASPGRDTLYCYNGDGRLRWAHGVSDSYRFENPSYVEYGLWIVKDFFVLQRGRNGKPQVFALAYKTPSYMTKLDEIDTKHGTTVQTYDHVGGLEPNLIYDVDGDGNDEILLGGINNAYQRACLVVLDPAHIEGVGPTMQGYGPVGGKPASEKYYIMLPFTEAGRLVSETVYNLTNAILPGKDHRGIIVSTNEVLKGPAGYEGGSVLYVFDSTMEVTSVTGGDDLMSLWNRLLKEGKVHSGLGQPYWDRIRDSVLYWNGREFLTHSTQNAHTQPLFLNLNK